VSQDLVIKDGFVGVTNLLHSLDPGHRIFVGDGMVFLLPSVLGGDYTAGIRGR
jgi:hypothetical protein